MGDNVETSSAAAVVNDCDEQTTYQPCEKRFRTSEYFLDDQLKCSDAIADFRSVKSLINQLTNGRLTGEPLNTSRKTTLSTASE